MSPSFHNTDGVRGWELRRNNSVCQLQCSGFCLFCGLGSSPCARDLVCVYLACLACLACFVLSFRRGREETAYRQPKEWEWRRKGKEKSRQDHVDRPGSNCAIRKHSLPLLLSGCRVVFSAPPPSLSALLLRLKMEIKFTAHSAAATTTTTTTIMCVCFFGGRFTSLCRST
jgi:hypothetical protein